MLASKEAPTRVAIMAASEKKQDHLSTLLTEAGVQVVIKEVAGEDFLRELEKTTADVLLVDLSEGADSEIEIIDILLEYDSLPVLYNDSSPEGGQANAVWAKQLARKLEKMAQSVKSKIAVELEQVIEPESNFEPELSVDPELDIHSAKEFEQELVFEADSEIKLEYQEELEQEDEVEDSFELALEPDNADKFELELESEADTELAIESEYELALEPASGFELEPLYTGEIEQSDEGISPSSTGLELEVAAEAKTDCELETPESEAKLNSKSKTMQGESAVAVRKTVPSFVDMPEGSARNIWVLGASLGGPQAVRQFLTAIKPDLPVAFILAQHIGGNHISLLAEQLDRVSKFKVFPGYSGHLIRHSEVILAPADKNISITHDGYLALSDAPTNAIYSPCINDVMTAVANRYGGMAGTIVFSGMGDDGAIGCQVMSENGGVVWAQDVESCVISSMPDQARKTNNVTYSGNPRALADQLYQYYSE